jgi:putative transposase
VLIAILYLKGVSTGDFEGALTALLGKDVGGLSASTVARPKDAWSDEHLRWSKRDLSAKRYVYFWADGIHVQALSTGRGISPVWGTQFSPLGGAGDQPNA